MTKKTALFGLIISGIVLISTIDISAQRRSSTRAGTPGGRVTNIAVDPSDPSGNTVYAGRKRTVEQPTMASVVAGNRIGTEPQMLNNKNPELTRYTNLSNSGSSVRSRSLTSVGDRTRPSSLRRNEPVEGPFIF